MGKNKSGRGRTKPSRRYTGYLLLIVFLALLAVSCSHESKAPPEPPPPPPGEQDELLLRLRALPGLQVTPLQTPEGFSRCYLVTITQPIDHQNPSLGTFQQSFYLYHRSENAPTVFNSSGYGVNPEFGAIMELTALLQANQISLVHRFFPGAYLQDWNYLTIRQAADDQHRIRETLKDIYPGKWVSMGMSKGGMAALFYRRFYPADVETTVAYSAPLMYVPDDPRFAPFLEQVGTAECREKILEFQLQAFSRRATLMPLFNIWGPVFHIISPEAAFEYTVLEFPFSFWQYGSQCDTIPGADATDQQIFDYLVDVSSPYYYTDDGVIHYRPLFYQAFTEIGYYPFIYEHVKEYLQAVPQPDYRVFAPRDVELVFRPEVMQDVIPWLQTEGEKIIYIYGGDDPWSAAAIELPAGVDALKIVQPGGCHRVGIGSLDQKALVIETLERWLNIPIDAAMLKAFKPSYEKIRM